MEQSLRDRSMLVTGGARRIGAAIVRRLHAAGARVGIHYRGAEAQARALEEELNAARPASACRLRADLLDPAAPEALVRGLCEAFGQLDVLVNSASAFYATPLGAVAPKHWEELVGSNLRAPFFLSQAAAAQLRRTRGAIVNIVDIHADRPLKGYPVYSVAKAGLAALTRALARELAPEVRVNAVAPGAIVWPEDGQFVPTERTRIVETTPLARTGTPEEIAAAVEFLAAASFVTGQVLAVDGGRSVYL